MPPTFGEYSLRLIRELEAQSRFGTSQTYEMARRSFESFLEEERILSGSEDAPDIALDRMDRSLIARYNRYLRGRGMLRNTMSFYNRVIRSIYNKGVKEYGFEDARPFSDVYTGVDRTRSRAVSEKAVAGVAVLDTGDDASLTLARDLFVFSYAMRGMPFVDMAYLRKSQIKEDVLTYTRRKTGGTIRVRIEGDVHEIIEKYAELTEGSEYLFPILCDATSGYGPEQEHTGRTCGGATAPSPEALYTRYRSGLASYNRNLKRLAAMAGIKESLSSYVARHSWATAARGIGCGVPVISEALGHSSERMTRIYMGSLDSTLVDDANRIILDRLDELKRDSRGNGTGDVRGCAIPAVDRKSSHRACTKPAVRLKYSTHACAKPVWRPGSPLRESLPEDLCSVPASSDNRCNHRPGSSVMKQVRRIRVRPFKRKARIRSRAAELSNSMKERYERAKLQPNI